MNEIPFDEFEYKGPSGKKNDSSLENRNYTPTPEEKQALKLAGKLFEKAKKWRKQYDNKWMPYYKAYRGKQWDEQRPSYRHTEVINLIFQTIQSQAPLLTDSRPKIEYVPRSPMHVELADILSQVAQSDWEDNNWLDQLVEIVYDSHIYGTGFAGIEFDPKAKFGMGSIVYESKDPFGIFPDPAARQVNDKRGKFFIEAEPVDIDQLKLDYPDKKEYLKADLMDLMQGTKTDLEPVRFKSPIDNRIMPDGYGSYDFEAKGLALKVTLYILSDDYIEEQVKDKSMPLVDQGGNSGGLEPADSAMPTDSNPPTQPTPEGVLYQQRKRWPNGRKIVMASGVLLEDSDNPYDDGKFPYAKNINYPLPREFYGQSEIEQILSPQKVLNKLVSFSLDVLTLMGNPVWVIDQTANIDTDNILNRPGMILEPEPGSRVERMEGVQLQPYVLNIIDRLKDYVNNIAGSTDVSRGVDPGSITAATAIEALQQVAQTRTRQKTRFMDSHLQESGQLYLSRVFQFYNSPRIFRITGNDGAQKYFKFHVEQLKDEAGQDQVGADGKPARKAHVRQFNQNEETGQYHPEVDAKEYLIEGEFDCRVSTGSSLPFAKSKVVADSINLFKLGVIDDEELLKNIDYPNYELVLQRVKIRRAEDEAKKAAMQAQGVAV